MIKRILSIFLALIMVLSIIPMSKIESSATSITSTQAISWCQSKVNSALDYDGEYGAQCVDFIMYYYQYLGVSPVGGDACDYATNSLPSGWTRTKGGVPQKGDILVYTGGYGHVAIYESTNVSYHQNWSGQYVEKVNRAYNQGYTYGGNTVTYWGCIHPNFAGSSTPSINYVTGLAGDYYLQNKNTGYWLSVSESKDASTQPINTWGTWWENFRVKLVASGNGYKMNFPLVSSLLVNPYSDTPTVGTKINLYQDVNDSTQWWGFEKVGDAYAIRCIYNPSLVLTSNGTNQATLTTYTGATNQLWYLHPYTRTVTYNANGGSGAPSSQTKYFNETLTLSSKKPTRTGYTFLGWSTSSSATSASYSAGGSFTTDANTTLYAVWKANTLDVYYNANGAETTLDTVVISNGMVCYASDGSKMMQTWTYNNTKSNGLMNHNNTMGLYKSGYSFVGWGTSPNGGTIFSQSDSTIVPTDLNPNVANGNCSITLYAIWERNAFTVSYNANNGTGAPAASSHQSGTAHTISSTIPERFGCTFLGWGPSATQYYWPGESFTVTSDITLYAIWAGAEWLSDWQVSEESANIFAAGCCKYYYIEPSYTRTYHFESTGSVDSRIAIYDSNGNELAFNDDSGEDYNFSLNFTAEGGKKYYVKIYAYSDNTGIIPFTVSPCWNVTYDANGGTGAPEIQNKIDGEALTLSTAEPTRTGYTFLGWSTSSSATSATYSAGGSFTTDADTTLYAVWERNIYTITYDANGGTGAPASQTKTHGIPIYLSSTVPIRSGYTFLGWARSSTATSALFAPGAEYISNYDSTLYAVWEENVPAITNQWVQDEKGWRYYDANGNIVTNSWLLDSVGWCYVGADGYCVTNCWKCDSKGWCYLGADGRMVTNKWVMDSKGWCYVGADGYCVTNKWMKDSKGWVYLDANGRMATNQWIKDSVGWCYVGADGYCLTNAWVKDSVGWCYLDSNGRMVINNWVYYNNQWYYLDANGYMVTGTKVIGGKTYKFASNGVWIG